MHPVCHRAVRLESPFLQAKGEGQPSRSRNGAVRKAPGGDGANLHMKKKWREEKRERKRGGVLAIAGATIETVIRETFCFDLAFLTDHICMS